MLKTAKTAKQSGQPYIAVLTVEVVSSKDIKLKQNTVLIR